MLDNGQNVCYCEYFVVFPWLHALAGHVKSGALWKNDRDKGADLMCSVNSSKKSTSIFSEMKVAETVYLLNTLIEQIYPNESWEVRPQLVSQWNTWTVSVTPRMAFPRERFRGPVTPCYCWSSIWGSAFSNSASFVQIIS